MTQRFSLFIQFGTEREEKVIGQQHLTLSRSVHGCRHLGCTVFEGFQAKSMHLTSLSGTEIPSTTGLFYRSADPG
ncbi:protein of unknown function [Kyrpidia spormannii]|uniref:Uncharacterized protein n=2 Tax=Kyrpidia spormannii TaxID=2055160 RepID=A0ACA8Z565_9BACL|nr:protein of unknown function [Kyrpidia spormannii]CAB3390422.1 protein of unknown function [Kyrpidia spormannii]